VAAAKSFCDFKDFIAAFAGDITAFNSGHGWGSLDFTNREAFRAHCRHRYHQRGPFCQGCVCVLWFCVREGGF